MNDGSEYATLYLKGGYDLSMTMDAAKFDETISFKGKGAVENNYIAKNVLEMATLWKQIRAVKDDYLAVSKLVESEIKQRQVAVNRAKIDEGLRTLMAQQHTTLQQDLATMLNIMKLKGKPLPAFAYENYKGGTTKSGDFKGKYIYIDVWATWCGPCRAEIPHLQKIEEKYKAKRLSL